NGNAPAPQLWRSARSPDHGKDSFHLLAGNPVCVCEFIHDLGSTRSRKVPINCILSHRDSCWEKIVLGHRHQIWQRRVQEKSSTKPAQGLRGETRGEPAEFNDVAHL